MYRYAFAAFLFAACAPTDLDFGSAPPPPVDNDKEPLSTTCEPLAYDEDELNGHVLLLGTQQKLVLSLPENPSTGYVWTVAGSQLPAPIDDQWNSSGTAPGSGGTRVLTWDALAPGDYGVSFELKREWETEGIDAIAFQVHVVAGCQVATITDPPTPAPTPTPTPQPLECQTKRFTHSQSASLNGASLAVGVGQDFTITLGENGTTGYQWNIAAAASELSLYEDSFQLENTGAIGTGGWRTYGWHTDALAIDGSYTITLVYKQSWNPTPLETVTVTIVGNASCQ